jgi:hypothetical protein
MTTVVVGIILALGCENPIDETPRERSERVNDRRMEAEAPRVPVADEVEIELVDAGVDGGDQGAGPSVVVVGVAARTRRGPSSSSEDGTSLDRVWDLLNLPQEEAEATALLRICGSEIEWANERDCIGIHQVAQNIRVDDCDNTRFSPHARKRITQCRMRDGSLAVPGVREVLDGEETLLSAMLRLSGRAIGVDEARSARGRWISQVTLACDVPLGFPERLDWDGRRRERCNAAVTLVRGLVSGDIQRKISNTAHPIAWGGRCEDHCDDPADPSTCRSTGACDDSIACRRGLARIPDTNTGNAFWCSVGSQGCSSEADPVCAQFASL